MRTPTKPTPTYGRIINERLQISTNKQPKWKEIQTFDLTDIDGFYNQDGTPNTQKNALVKKEQRIKEIQDEMDLLLPSVASSMFLMLEYANAKNPDLDANDTNESLTPTGEDIITWGDRIHQELKDKMLEIKALDANKRKA